MKIQSMDIIVKLSNYQHLEKSDYKVPMKLNMICTVCNYYHTF